jgi:hypothetical protein
MEALQPLAVEIGLVAEQRVRVGRASFAFQMTKGERAGLTPRALLSTFRSLCLEPAGVAVPARALRLELDGRPLRSGEPIPEAGALVLRLAPGAGLRESEVLARLRQHARSRFRG